MRYNYDISVIMAVYNVELFLREAVDSLIAQDMGFARIQLIMVDDGSTDSSGAICDEYAAKYPNILVLHKENGGVSSARNLGLEHVEGRLVNFMDSDDLMTPETFRSVYQFYLEHRDETDIFVLPIYFFDAQTGPHMSNGKCKRGTRVIDLEKEWSAFQLSSSTAFIKAECLADLRFDTNLSYAEDAKLVQRVLAKRWTMGVVTAGRYLYRKRSAGESSAIQSSVSRPGWYLPYIKGFQQDTVRFYQETFGLIPKFIQNTLMYDLQWRFKMADHPEGVISDGEMEEYLRCLYGMLEYIDDDVILAQKNLFSEHKLFLLRKKHGAIRRLERPNDVSLYCGSTLGAKLSNCACRYEFLQIQNGRCALDCRVQVYAGEENDLSFSLLVNGQEYPCRHIRHEAANVALGEPIQYVFSVSGDFPLEGDQPLRLSVQMHTGNSTIRLGNVLFGGFFPVSRTYKAGYAVQNGWKLSVSGAALLLTPVTPAQVKQCEKALRKELWKRNKEGERKAVLARFLRNALLRFKKKPLWLISDRAAKAGDNGEALFRHIRANHPEIDARFILVKGCADEAPLKQVGPVVAKDSFKHKLLLLMADYLISSHGEVDIYNPFSGHSEPYRDLLADNRFVFLQHGITKDDISGWLNRYNKNLYGFITAAKPEYESILNGAYFYTEQQVWLTGFPRFDRLYENNSRQITIMPTWRQYLMGDYDDHTKERTVSSVFLNSEYMAFYNALLNHPKLLAAAKQLGYQLAFMPHPNLQPYLDLFQQNDQVKFLGRESEYKDIYAASALVLTDYSSAVFDFSYLHKPIVYTHFDAEEFFAGEHVYTKGYFDYERDGFGEVEYDLEDTVDRLVEYMENGCQLKDKYRERIDAFFAFNDKNNCQRVCDKLLTEPRHARR